MFPFKGPFPPEELYNVLQGEMHSHTPGHLTLIITTRLEASGALTKPAKVYEPQNQEQRSQGRWGEVDTMNVGNFATEPPSGNKTPSPSLSGFLFLEVFL